MSEDPKLFDAGDYNLFRYCHNDPIDSVDPMGLQDTVDTNSPRQTSQLKADEEYARAMGEAQWNMRWSTAGAVGMGMAGYDGWSALQKTVGITGQVIGGRVDYSHAPMGDANDREAPGKVEIIGNKDFDDYKLYRLQVETKTGAPITGTVYSKENVQLDTTKTRANFVPELSTTNKDFIAGAKGVITDRVGLLYRQSGTATGDVYTRQTYQVGYGGSRYNIGTQLQRHVQIINGRFMGADLTIVGP
jgi:subtilisin family serine protease